MSFVEGGEWCTLNQQCVIGTTPPKCGVKPIWPALIASVRQRRDMIFECKNEFDNDICERKVKALMYCRHQETTETCIFNTCKKLPFFERFNCRAYCRVCNWSYGRPSGDHLSGYLTPNPNNAMLTLIGLLSTLLLVIIGAFIFACRQSDNSKRLANSKPNNSNEKLHPIQHSVTS